jgi:hypothetical protein
MWPDYERRMPGFYQLDFFELRHKFGDGSDTQNSYRVRPSDFLDRDVIDLHLWEIEENIRFVMKRLVNLPHYAVWWVEEIAEAVRSLPKFLDGHYLDVRHAQHVAGKRFGKQCVELRPETIKWVDQLIEENSEQIIERFGAALRQYDIPHSQTVL